MDESDSNIRSGRPLLDAYHFHIRHRHQSGVKPATEHRDQTLQMLALALMHSEEFGTSAHVKQSTTGLYALLSSIPADTTSRTWDAAIIGAGAPGSETVYSEDPGDGQTYGTVRVINPFKTLWTN